MAKYFDKIVAESKKENPTKFFKTNASWFSELFEVRFLIKKR